MPLLGTEIACREGGVSKKDLPQGKGICIIDSMSAKGNKEIQSSGGRGNRKETTSFPLRSDLPPESHKGKS